MFTQSEHGSSRAGSRSPSPARRPSTSKPKAPPELVELPPFVEKEIMHTIEELQKFTNEKTRSIPAQIDPQLAEYEQQRKKGKKERKKERKKKMGGENTKKMRKEMERTSG